MEIKNQWLKCPMPLVIAIKIINMGAGQKYIRYSYRRMYYNSLAELAHDTGFKLVDIAKFENMLNGKQIEVELNESDFKQSLLNVAQTFNDSSFKRTKESQKRINSILSGDYYKYIEKYKKRCTKNKAENRNRTRKKSFEYKGVVYISYADYKKKNDLSNYELKTFKINEKKNLKFL